MGRVGGDYDFFKCLLGVCKYLFDDRLWEIRFEKYGVDNFDYDRVEGNDRLIIKIVFMWDKFF